VTEFRLCSTGQYHVLHGDAIALNERFPNALSYHRTPLYSLGGGSAPSQTAHMRCPDPGSRIGVGHQCMLRDGFQGGSTQGWPGGPGLTACPILNSDTKCPRTATERCILGSSVCRRYQHLHGGFNCTSLCWRSGEGRVYAIVAGGKTYRQENCAP